MTAASEHELACERVCARIKERWLRHYVSSKLHNDPMFPVAFELFQESSAPITDIGCGVGLLAAYLRERGCAQRVIGIDGDSRKIVMARDITARAGYSNVEFRHADVTQGADAFEGDVVLFDVLHYLGAETQRRLLASVAAQLPAGGKVAIRDAPRDSSMRFLLTYLGEKFAQAVSWNMRTRLHFFTPDFLRDFFPAAAFAEEVRPMWGRMPFNNYLFVFRRR